MPIDHMCYANLNVCYTLFSVVLCSLLRYLSLGITCTFYTSDQKRRAEEELPDGIERGKPIRIPPSSLGGKPEEYDKVQKEKMLHNGYPQSLQSPPLVLYHPVFATS